MEDEFRTLAAAWVYWNDLARIPDVSVSTDCPDCLISFICTDQTFHLHRDSEWWVVDSVDDRGTRYDDTARFTSIQLLEKYLVWLWGSSARSALSLPSLGANIYKQGRSASVAVTPTDSEWKFEITCPGGRAILPEPEVTIFSHLVELPLGKIVVMLGYPDFTVTPVSEIED